MMAKRCKNIPSIWLHKQFGVVNENDQFVCIFFFSADNFAELAKVGIHLEIYVPTALENFKKEFTCQVFGH